MTQRIPPDLLRDMVREILQDVIDSEVGTRVDELSAPDAASARWRETVTIASQSDLDRAVRRILSDSTDPQRRGAIERGDIAFLLGPTAAVATVPAAAEVLHRVERGAVTERHVRAAAEAGAVIVTATRVVVTPLAKDKARSLGVVIRRES